MARAFLHYSWNFTIYSMSRISFLHDILSTVLDRRGGEPHVEDDRPLQELCEALLSSRGEVSGNRLSQAILQRFSEGDEEQKLEFFLWMLHSLDIDADAAAEAVSSYGQDQSPETWQALVNATAPKRLELLRRINRIHEATGQWFFVKLIGEHLPIFLRKSSAMKRFMRSTTGRICADD